MASLELLSSVMAEKPQTFLYETLRPLSGGGAAGGDVGNPCFVIRNEVSLTDGRSVDASPVTETVDFFSFNVGDESPAREPKQAEPETPAREAELRLESSWFRGNSKFRSPMLQLHKEIVDFCEFLSPTLEEQEYRNNAIERVVEVIKYIWPNCKVEVFGSFKTGLYLPSSDIDVVILGSGDPPQKGLRALSRALSQRSLAKKIQVIAKARVPIIKFIEKTSNFSFDISFDLQNGPMAADYIQEAIRRLPPLRPLCLILKVFLQQRELNEVYTGGLGSYALLTMVMAMLQSRRRSEEQNLGILLVQFFNIYGRKLITADVGVSCNGRGTFFSKESKGFIKIAANNGRPPTIAIEDPQAPDNDIGKSSFNYYQIRSAFSNAFSTLTDPKTVTGLGPNRSILGTIIRPDSVLVDRKGGSHGQVTFASLLPGAGDPLPSRQGPEELLGNWRLGLDEDEPLPRGGTLLVGEPAGDSSGKKRKKASGKRQKAREKEEASAERRRENGSERREKKRSKARNDVNGYGQSVAPWS